MPPAPRGLHLLSQVTITQQPGPKGQALVTHGSPPHRKTERVCVKTGQCAPRPAHHHRLCAGKLQSSLYPGCFLPRSLLVPRTICSFSQHPEELPTFQILTPHFLLDRCLPPTAGLLFLSPWLLRPSSAFPSDAPLLGLSSAPERPSLAHPPSGRHFLPGPGRQP